MIFTRGTTEASVRDTGRDYSEEMILSTRGTAYRDSLADLMVHSSTEQQA